MPPRAKSAKRQTPKIIAPIKSCSKGVALTKGQQIMLLNLYRSFESGYWALTKDGRKAVVSHCGSKPRGPIPPSDAISLLCGVSNNTVAAFARKVKKHVNEADGGDEVAPAEFFSDFFTVPKKRGPPPSGLPKQIKMCADCGSRRPTWGLPAQGDQKKETRWCAACAKAYADAVNMGKKCEDCNQMQPFFLLATDTTARWCRPCSKKGFSPKRHGRPKAARPLLVQSL